MNEKISKKTGIPFASDFVCCPVGDPVHSEYRLARPDVDGVRKLVEVGKVDIREVVQSSYQNSFDAILDRFLESGDLPSSVGRSPENQDFLLDALDVASDYADFMESARELYDLPPEMSFTEIRNALQSKLDELNKTNKGDDFNEKTNQAPQNVEPEKE